MYDVLSATAAWWIFGVIVVSALVFLGGCAYLALALALVTVERPPAAPDSTPLDVTPWRCPWRCPQVVIGAASAGHREGRHAILEQPGSSDSGDGPQPGQDGGSRSGCRLDVGPFDPADGLGRGVADR